MDLFKARKLVKAINTNDGSEVERLVSMYPRLVHTRLRRGEFALHIAALNHMEAVNILIRHGADVNERDDIGNTPLMNAVLMWDDIVELLLLHGADPMLRNKLGYSPVDLAKWILQKHGSGMSKEGQHRIKRIVTLLDRSLK